MKMKTQSFVILAVLVIVVAGIYASLQQVSDVSGLKRFSSYDELKSFVKMNTENYYGGTFGAMTSTAVSSAKVETTAGQSSTAPNAADRTSDYSQTNVQVAGVDEPDIVKNDGKYIYVVTGRNVTIVNAYPAENANIVSQIELNGTPQEIFVNGDRLVVFGWEDYSYTTSIATDIGILPPRVNTQKTFIDIYDITDRSNPVLERNVSVDGNYYDARMIGDYVYAIVNDPIYYSITDPIAMPMIQSGSITKTVAASDIYYFDYPDSSYVFTNMVALNVQRRRSRR